jgi:hypothetical protein
LEFEIRRELYYFLRFTLIVLSKKQIQQQE